MMGYVQVYNVDNRSFLFIWCRAVEWRRQTRLYNLPPKVGSCLKLKKILVLSLLSNIIGVFIYRIFKISIIGLIRKIPEKSNLNINISSHSNSTHHYHLLKTLNTFWCINSRRNLSMNLCVHEDECIWTPCSCSVINQKVQNAKALACCWMRCVVLDLLLTVVGMN